MIVFALMRQLIMKIQRELWTCSKVASSCSDPAKNTHRWVQSVGPDRKSTRPGSGPEITQQDNEMSPKSGDKTLLKNDLWPVDYCKMSAPQSRWGHGYSRWTDFYIDDIFAMQEKNRLIQACALIKAYPMFYLFFIF